MSIVAVKRARKERPAAAVGPWPVVGTVHSVSAAGAVLVDYPGNLEGPLPARLMAAAGDMQAVPGSAVVLMFEDLDASRPIILGTLSDRLAPPQLTAAAGARKSGHTAVVDGERVVLEAQREIVLRCGRSSITLTADGKVVIKGTELVSRSSGANKIKGALVNIN